MRLTPIFFSLMFLLTLSLQASLRVSYNAYFPQDSDFDTEYGPSIALGWFLPGDFIFLEIEAGYLQNDGTKGFSESGFSGEADFRQRTVPVLAHANLAFPLGERSLLYGGLTAGAAYLDVKGDVTISNQVVSEKISDVVFVYGGGGGFLFNITSALHLDLQYRYLKFSDAQFTADRLPGSVTIEVPDAHRVSIGAVLKF